MYSTGTRVWYGQAQGSNLWHHGAQNHAGGPWLARQGRAAIGKQPEEIRTYDKPAENPT